MRATLATAFPVAALAGCCSDPALAGEACDPPAGRLRAPVIRTDGGGADP
jgi:hypothetical protein